MAPRVIAVSAVFLLLEILFISSVSHAQIIQDGDLVRADGAIDIYIVKLVPSTGSGQAVKKFKRLILNPDIFNQYSHLSWNAVKTVDQGIINGFVTANTVRWIKDKKVYLLSPNGDVGTKHWLNMTPVQFETAGYDWDAVYLINEHEYRSYTLGDPITVASEKVSYAPFSYGLVADVGLLGQLEKLEELGVDLTREEEPLAISRFGFLQGLKNAGIDLIVINVDKKRFISDPGVHPPSHFDSWVQVLKFSVQKNPDATYWQVWNEPNEALFWQPRPDAAAYTELLKKSYIAIKEANPNAKVLNGGLSGVGPAVKQYLRDMYANGAGKYFDILALHPYGQPNSPDTYLRDFLYEIKNIMNANGDVAKPIWITEIGWPTDPSQFGYVSEQTQADYLQKTYDIARSLDFVEAVFWYRLYDPVSGMGIVGKPAENVYKNLK
ncbi:MAG: glycosyl hydrolase [Candidatus Taylorbacteria bacterium]|nr:glycosyl hydrolase [Candidatus Taylorbacteria bacterium]